MVCIRFTRYICAFLRFPGAKKVRKRNLFPRQFQTKAGVGESSSVSSISSIRSTCQTLFLSHRVTLNGRSYLQFVSVTFERPRQYKFLFTFPHFFVSVKYHDFFIIWTVMENVRRNIFHTHFRSFLPKEFIITKDTAKNNENDWVVNPRPKKHLSSCRDRLILLVTREWEWMMNPFHSEMISFMILETGFF